MGGHKGRKTCFCCSFAVRWAFRAARLALPVLQGCRNLLVHGHCKLPFSVKFPAPGLCHATGSVLTGGGWFVAVRFPHCHDPLRMWLPSQLLGKENSCVCWFPSGLGMRRGAWGSGVWPGVSQAREECYLGCAHPREQLHYSIPDHPGKRVCTHSWGRTRGGGAFAGNLFQSFPLFPQNNHQIWELLPPHWDLLYICRDSCLCASPSLSMHTCRHVCTSLPGEIFNLPAIYFCDGGGWGGGRKVMFWWGKRVFGTEGGSQAGLWQGKGEKAKGGTHVNFIVCY